MTTQRRDIESPTRELCRLADQLETEQGGVDDLYEWGLRVAIGQIRQHAQYLDADEYNIWYGKMARYQQEEE